MPTLDLDQHKALAARRAHRRRRGTPPPPAGLPQAEVSAKHLTGEPNWDVFLQYLSAEVSRLIDVEESANHVLQSPSVTAHDQMMTAKIQLHRAMSARQILEDVISLPKRLIEAGEAASSLQDIAAERNSAEPVGGGK